VFTLPSQPTEYTTRTAAHLRTMLYMSYFHLNATNLGHRRWISTSITSMVPWEIKYTGQNAGILGIMYLGEQPTSVMVRDTIDGTLVAIVVLDDIAGIPGRKEYDKNLHKEGQQLRKSGYKDEEFTGTKSATLDDGDSGRSLIVRTPEGIPYFNTEIATALDPRHSHTTGLALIRGIDIKRKRLQLITPVSWDILRDAKASNKPIILVSGKFDTPGWAYAEDMNLRASIHKTSTHQQPSNVPEAEMQDGGTHEKGGGQADNPKRIGVRSDYTPWIERLHGDEGRGAGARVWRVRRDLGRNSVGK